MGVNSLPKTVTPQRRDCDLNTGPSAPESSTLTTRLPSHSSFYTNQFDLDICTGVMTEAHRGLKVKVSG